MANDLSAFNTIAFSKKLIMNLDKTNVMMNLVNRDWEGDLKNVGDSVKVRTLGSVTMGAYTKGGTIAYEDLAPSTETMTIDDAQYFAFKVDDIDKAQTDINVLEAYARRAAVSMNDVVEAKLLSNYADANAANQVTGASAAAIALTEVNIYAQIVEARKRLNKMNVPSMGRWMVIDPDTEALLLQANIIVNGGTNMNYETVKEGQVNGQKREGFVGRIAGFDVYCSNNVPVVSGAKYIQFGDPFAIAYAAQITEVERLRLQTTFADAIRGLLLHDTKVFTENAKRLGYIKAVA
ncbi:MAG: P22 phage major capsid protein family protein [Pyrinomonadaceae bacterium]